MKELKLTVVGLAGVVLALLAAAAPLALATEGGTSHVQPGANATLVDLPPTTPGWFFKPMYINYRGNVSARIPTAAGIVTNAKAEANTLALGGGYGFEQTVLGAHYGAAIFLPYTWLDISASSQALGGVKIKNNVSGLGDLTVVPVMMAWKFGDWQLDFLVPVYAPTGDYKVGRLGNTGLNYWTFDPQFGGAYSNAKFGFNAAIHMGFASNTENHGTDYQSGNMLHVESSLQQILPVGPGYVNFGAEAWYFQQVSGDSGSGAKLGDLKGRTAGIGPVLGYIQPIGDQKLLLEFKWLPELYTRNRLKGDYLWLKAVYKF